MPTFEDERDDRAGSMRASDRVPSPDPTVLTSAALYREVAGLERRFDEAFEALTTRMVLNFENFDQRIELLNRERLEQLSSMVQLSDEKNDGLTKLVAQQFDLIERQRLEQKQDTKTAVDAALQAQKEAVREQTTASALSIAKSETATSKQLEQQQVTTATAISDLRRSIDELKERIGDVDRNARNAVSEVAQNVNGGVQRGVGAKEDRSSLYATIGILATALFVVLAIATFIATRT